METIYLNKHYTLFYLLLAGLFCACSPKQQVAWTSTSPDSGFVEKLPVSFSDRKDSVNVTVFPDNYLQTIDGFGGCFNELGWTTLSALSEADRKAVVEDLFGETGMNFTYCRMPVGANDFARDWYSYNETANDFEMSHFSIDNDKETLIPFIHAAQQVNPKLRIWASPWSPPTWMKYNNNYACRPNPQVNELAGDPRTDLEGSNMFIQEPEYFKAYALYFRKFIEAYRKEGIDIEMIAPQNEFNSCQVFPSCTWTAAGLSTFIADYLGPQMKELGVRTMFGTMERGNHLLVDTIMQNNSGSFISEIGFQWAGKEAIAAIHSAYPDMKLMQSESECGNGQNTWEYCFYIWNLMKHYFSNGAASYMYWNISLDIHSENRWGWHQNSLISVDQENKTYRYNPEYYLMKHFSHFVKPGARRIVTEGDFGNMLAFSNPDQSIILIATNEEQTPRKLNIQLKDRVLSVTLDAQSINTFTINNYL
ncbi:glycosyl hydrolase [Bacteroidia bacterium]|nr:glycosyl hydrolase [Bacteroidia bacterium]GHT27462.1 glycosyl hydrolase [Bacteroidia bacterium]